MLIIKDSIFAPKPLDSALAVATCGYIRRDGRATWGPRSWLGRQLKKRYRGIEERLGEVLQKQGRPVGHASVYYASGNHVATIWDDPKIFSFPIKWNFWEKADRSLIERSCQELLSLVNLAKVSNVYIHPIGDGMNHLEVVDLLDHYLDSRFVVCYEEGI